MKEIVLALKDSIESRVKNKVIASFLIAWTFLHWKGISILLLSEKKDMINIIREYEFSCLDDFLIPLFYGGVYITIFQLVIYAVAFLSEITDNCISKWSAGNAIKKLSMQRRMNNIAILSEYDYQKMVKKEKLKATHEKNIALEQQNNSLSASLDKEISLREDNISENQKLMSKYSLASKKTIVVKHETKKIIRTIESIANETKTKNDDFSQFLHDIAEAVSTLENIMPDSQELSPYEGDLSGMTEIDIILKRLHVKVHKISLLGNSLEV